MTTTPMPTRIDPDLYDAAKAVGGVMSRSAAQQINHWARIGRELEAAAGFSQRDIARVLAGQASYDGLTGEEQTFVRATWDVKIAQARSGLDLAAEFEAAGITDWVEADADGNTIIGNPTVIAAIKPNPATSEKPAKPTAKKTAKKAAALPRAAKSDSRSIPTSKSKTKGTRATRKTSAKG